MRCRRDNPRSTHKARCKRRNWQHQRACRCRLRYRAFGSKGMCRHQTRTIAPRCIRRCKHRNCGRRCGCPRISRCTPRAVRTCRRIGLHCNIRSRTRFRSHRSLPDREEHRCMRSRMSEAEPRMWSNCCLRMLHRRRRDRRYPTPCVRKRAPRERDSALCPRPHTIILCGDRWTRHPKCAIMVLRR